MQRVVVLVLVLRSRSAPTSPARTPTPVDPLPKHPTTTILATCGSLVALALPRQRSASGLVWRLARPADPRILRRVSEADVGPSVVIVSERSAAAQRGSASPSLGATRGPARSPAPTYSNSRQVTADMPATSARRNP